MKSIITLSIESMKIINKLPLFSFSIKTLLSRIVVADKSRVRIHSGSPLISWGCDLAYRKEPQTPALILPSTLSMPVFGTAGGY